MSQSLRVLIVEDVETDAALICYTLRRVGYEVNSRVVDTPEAMRAALESEGWDVITSDHSMPCFSAPEALAIGKELRPEIPFIIVSGEIDLNLAVSLMKEGAQDYIQKRELARLVSTIERELREVELRRERKRAEEALRRSEAKYRLLTENMKDVIWTLNPETLRFTSISPSVERLRGFTPEEIMAQPMDAALTQEAADYLKADLRQRVLRFSFGQASADLFQTDEVEQPCKDGTTILTEVVSNLILNEETGQVELLGVTRDITKRKRVEEELNKRINEISLLYQASQNIGKNLDLDHLLHTFYQQIAGIMDCDAFFVSSYDEQQQLIRCVYGYSENARLDVSGFPAIPLEPEGKGMQSRVIRSGRPWMLNDCQPEIKKSQTRYYITPKGEVEKFEDISEDEDVTRSVIILPLLFKEKVLGVIQIFSYRLNAYSQENFNIAEALVAQFTIAYNNALLYRDAQQMITERKKAEEALREREKQRRVILETAMDGFWLADLQGNLLEVNQSYCQMSGYSMQELLAIRISDLESKETAGDTATHIQKVLAQGQDRFQSRHRRKDGSLLDVEVSVQYQAMDGGRLVVFLQDISERKQAEEKIQADQIELQRLLAETEQARRALLDVVEDQKKAEEEIRRLNSELERRVAERTAQLTAANQELEAFSYSVSHDLRAPLRSLDGFSAILMEDYARQLDEQGQRYLSRIRESSKHMEQLIHDLMILSQVNRADLKRRLVNLSLLAGKIAAEMQAQAPERRVAFDIAPNLIVQGDENLITIVMENLLNNAFKFTGRREQAVIQIGLAAQAGKEVVYFVRDNGAGFDMAHAHKLFGAFQRLHNQGEFPGTGIGLATVQRIILRHGGRIWAESAVDQGAIFYFTLAA
jgi:PAS domain S-box-containing protein